jgi:hypothetical protein
MIVGELIDGWGAARHDIGGRGATMAERTMIERIARILCEAGGNPAAAHDTTPSMRVPEGNVDWQRFEPTAREILIEMREPSGAMTEAGQERAKGIYPSSVMQAEAVFISMIDGALGEDAK